MEEVEDPDTGLTRMFVPARLSTTRGCWRPTPTTPGG
jgi:hypothetical protein